MNAKHIAANTIRGFFKGDRDSKVALRESHIPVETLKRIKTPTLCVVGERDRLKSNMFVGIVNYYLIVA